MKKAILFAATLALIPSVAGASPYRPTYGSPNSLQFQTVRTDLDLETVQPEGEDRLGPEGDSDTIGGAFTYWGVTGQSGQRYDLHYQHARRVAEGSRMRFLVDVPINILHVGPSRLTNDVKGATAVLGTVNVGLEVPVQKNWLITPRISYGATSAGPYFGGDGEIAAGSVTSRVKIGNVGRGDLIIGNMVAYTHTVKLLTSEKFFAPTINWVFRNGIAYQLPLKTRMFGRQASLRASYVFTTATQDPLSYKQVHEVGFSIGVRSREAEQKNRFDQLRIGILYTHSKNEFAANFDYDAATLTLGYRF
ncbi:MAG: hypothetical protein ACKVOL_14505 [Novosphingobium sp.]